MTVIVAVKMCKRCGERPVYGKAHNAKYCEECAVVTAKELGKKRKSSPKDKAKRKEYSAAYFAIPENRERMLANNRTYHKRIKENCFALRNNVCQECGGKDRLEAHHINGDGTEHRKRLNLTGSRRMYIELTRNPYDVAWCLLCYDCHKVVTGFEIAAHARQRQIDAGVKIVGGPDPIAALEAHRWHLRFLVQDYYPNGDVPT